MTYASINGQEIFFEDSGGNGLAVIMMHGFLMDTTLFDHQVSVLTPKYRVIRFDARAFGKTKWDGQPFNLYDTVSDCILLMDFLRIEKAVIMGMSQGGYAALRLALKHPERVMALVLMSTQAGIDDAETKAQFTKMRDTWVEHGPVEPLLEGLATVLLGPKHAPGMDLIWDGWLKKWRSLPKNALFHAMNNLLSREDITDQIEKLNQPALVTHGDNDFGMPMELGLALRKNLPNCKQFVRVKGAAHAANFTHPDLINNALLQFLTNLVSAADAFPERDICRLTD